MSRLRTVLAAYEATVAVAKLARAVRGHPEAEWSLWGVLSDPAPWHLPTLVYRVPLVPVRIWMRCGDALLFRLWWHSRPVVYALADELRADPVREAWRDPGAADDPGLSA